MDDTAARAELSRVLRQMRGPQTVSAVRRLLAANPAVARLKGEEGRVPLNEALRYREDSDMVPQLVDLLLYAYPEALQCRTDTGNLPLHNAAGHQDAAVVEVLAKLYPQALTTRQEIGSLPLHFAAQWQSGEKGAAVVEVLARLCPQALTTGNNDG